MKDENIPMRIAISDARTNMLSSDFVIEYAGRALIHAEHDLVQILCDYCCMLLNTIRLTFLVYYSYGLQHASIRSLRPSCVDANLTLVTICCEELVLGDNFAAPFGALFDQQQK